VDQQHEMHPVLVGILIFGGLATLVWVAGLIWGMADIIGLI
jgi:hypothetical protein